MSSHQIFKVGLKDLHPIDAAVHYNAYRLLPMFKKLNYTPNDLTTESIICGLFSVCFLYRGNAYLAVLSSFMSYFFDVADGLYARRYNMVTKFGDYYDHVSDIIQYILYVGILIYKYNLLDHKLIIRVLLPIQLIGLSLYLGCVEKIYTKESSPTLSIFRRMCIINPKKNVPLLKFFSPMNNLIILYLITILLVGYY